MGWRDRAACSPHTPGDYPPSWFVPPEHLMETQDSKWTDGKLGQKVCLTSCPVAVECLVDHYHEEYGVWGGVLPTRRRRFRRQVKGLSRAEIKRRATREVDRMRDTV